MCLTIFHSFDLACAVLLSYNVVHQTMCKKTPSKQKNCLPPIILYSMFHSSTDFLSLTNSSNPRCWSIFLFDCLHAMHWILDTLYPIQFGVAAIFLFFVSDSLLLGTHKLVCANRFYLKILDILIKQAWLLCFQALTVNTFE